MIDFHPAPSIADDAPRTWRRLDIGDGRYKASIVCPNGHYGTLEDHDIRIDGAVVPSVVCPQEACGFHDEIRLVGWQPAVPAKRGKTK